MEQSLTVWLLPAFALLAGIGIGFLIARLVPNHSRKEDVFALFGPPYETALYPRMEREVWSWHMRRFGVIPVGLHVQMSPDGVVREVLLLDEQKNGERSNRK